MCAMSRISFVTRDIFLGVYTNSILKLCFVAHAGCKKIYEITIGSNYTKEKAYVAWFGAFHFHMKIQAYEFNQILGHDISTRCLHLNLR